MMEKSKKSGVAPGDCRVLVLSRLLFRAAFALLGGLRISGVENIPVEGGALICPNHISDFDPLAVLVAISRNDFNALGKSELFEIPVLGRYLQLVGALPVIRDSADRAALRSTEAVLNSRRLMLIFPEGRCSESGVLQTVQPGASMLSLKTGCPIVPAGIRGTNKILPYSALSPRFAGGGASIVFGAALHPAEYRALPQKDAVRKLNADLRTEILRLTLQPC
jgi:1-acyl-sn-glycerol-3-phosphate acyltransferase